MKTVIEVTKNNNEMPMSLIRRFTKRVRGSGVLQKVRGNRFFTRKESHYKQKGRALTNIRRGKEIERLKKLGKIPG